MFYNNISYLVGSANAKLADDIKRIQKETRTKPSRFPSYLFCNSIRQSSDLSNSFNLDKLDFEIVKISCKKELPSNHDDKAYIVKNLFFKNSKLEFLIKALLFVLIGSIVALAIFRVINVKTNFKLFNQTSFDNDFNRSIRSANIYSMDNVIEWSSEKIPMCYEVEPLTFYDSDNDGFGDLNGIIQKLDYFKNVLIVNCLIIKNLHSFFDLNEFILNQSNSIDPKIGQLNDLLKLVDSAHRNQIRVLLEIDLTGTSIHHEMFQKDSNNIYLSTNTTDKQTNKWNFNEKFQTYYYSNNRTDFVYFDYDNINAQQTIIEIFKFWYSFNSDGFYLKNFKQIQYKNTTRMNEWIETIHSIIKSASVPIALIGNYSTDDSLLNKLFNILHVEIDVNRIKQDIVTFQTESLDLIEFHLKNDKKILWSLVNLQPKDSDLIKEFYFMLYSLPGLCLIKQGDELENDPIDHLEIFYWNNQAINRGFSNNTQMKLKAFPSFKMDLKSNLNKQYSLVNFLKFLNERIKMKLNDLKPIKKFTTHLPVVPKAPQPFKNSFNSMSQRYLLDNYYNITNWKSVLKITRQIHNRRLDNSLRFYRNVLFLFNFSQLNISLDHLIGFVPNKRDLSTTIHVLYDSTNLLPEYITLDAQNHLSFHRLNTQHYLALEF